MPDVVAIGECMVEFFSEESLDTAPSFAKAYSGDTLNVMTMLSRLGTSSGYITRVGNDPAVDPWGDSLIEDWERLGVDTSAVVRVPGFVGLVFISLQSDGHRSFVYYRKGSAASTIVPEDLDEDYIGGAKVLHVSALPQAVSETSRATVKRAVEIARDRGVTVSFDTNLRLNLWTIEEARAAVNDILPFVDILFPSYPDETRLLTGIEDAASVIDHYHSLGIETVALKCGEDGAVVSTSEVSLKAKSIAPNGVVDTTGAGDAFVGGFLHAMVQGLEPFEGLKWGVASAGLKVAGRGGIASQPARDDVERYLEQVEVEPF